MDNLTHAAVGLFLSRAGLDRFCAQAPWILVLAANAPDIDIVTLAGGPLAYLHYHRHLTHSLAAMPVMALLPVLLVRAFTRRPFSWRAAYALSLVGVASHLLLDYTNVYGIRFLLPFSGRWFRLDTTGVVDLWIWLAFAVALAAPPLGRLVNAEIGARSTGGSRGFAIFALVFLVVYNGARSALHARAVAVEEARIYAGGTPRRVAALPSPGNPLVWRGLVETEDSYHVQEFSLLEDFDPGRGTVYYKAEPGPAVSAANGTEVFREFFNFSQFPLERTMPASEPESGTRVEAMDMRFGTPAEPRFVATAILGKRMEVLRAWFGFGAIRAR
jgi:inner membrane protein